MISWLMKKYDSNSVKSFKCLLNDCSKLTSTVLQWEGTLLSFKSMTSMQKRLRGQGSQCPGGTLPASVAGLGMAHDSLAFVLHDAKHQNQSRRKKEVNSHTRQKKKHTLDYITLGMAWGWQSGAYVTMATLHSLVDYILCIKCYIVFDPRKLCKCFNKPFT